MGRGRSAKTLKAMDACYEIAKERQPITVRGVAYALLQVYGMIPSMDKKYTNMVSRWLTDMRNEGALPWEWIVDDTRRLRDYCTWDNPQKFIESEMRAYRQNFWEQQPHHIEVWCEKATITGVIQPILDRYRLPFLPMRGYGSTTVVHDIVCRAFEMDKPFIALYIGDFDPSGMNMSEVDLPQRLDEHGFSHPDAKVDIVRVALTEGDIHGMIPLPLKNDPRVAWYTKRYGHQCWEVDGLDPRVLRGKLDNAVLKYLDVNSWNHCMAIERAERQSMENFFKAYPTTTGHLQ